tara:strand:+ start:21955 stop:22230 length:276 start_codon:yes stop_codon:yes gene_type:complete
MYAKYEFGLELRKKVWQKESIIKIAQWAYKVYSNNLGQDFEGNLDQVLLDLNTMELGDEYSGLYKSLNKIAEDLILGKDVDLNLKEYGGSL